MPEFVGSFVAITASGQREVAISSWLEGNRAILTAKGHWDEGEIVSDFNHESTEAALDAAKRDAERSSGTLRGSPGHQGLLRHRDFDPVPDQAPSWGRVDAERVGQLLQSAQKPTPR